MRRFLVVAATWAHTALSQILASKIGCAETSSSYFDVVLFIVASALMALLVYCQLHICRGFQLAIGNSRAAFFKGQSFEKAIYERSILQAMLSQRSTHH